MSSAFEFILALFLLEAVAIAVLGDSAIRAGRRITDLERDFHESQKEGIFCGRCRKCWNDAGGGPK